MEEKSNLVRLLNNYLKEDYCCNDCFLKKVEELVQEKANYDDNLKTELESIISGNAVDEYEKISTIVALINEFNPTVSYTRTREKIMGKNYFVSYGLEYINIYDSIVYFDKAGNDVTFEVALELSRIKDIVMYGRYDYHLPDDESKHMRHYYFRKLVIEIKEENLPVDELNILQDMHLASIDLYWDDSYRDICWIEMTKSKKDIVYHDGVYSITIDLPEEDRKDI